MKKHVEEEEEEEGEKVKVPAKDEALTCRDCKAAFTFTAGEQVFPDL